MRCLYRPSSPSWRAYYATIGAIDSRDAFKATIKEDWDTRMLFAMSDDARMFNAFLSRLYEGKRGATEFNRNPILHGANVTYDTEENSLLLILTFLEIRRYLCSRRRRRLSSDGPAPNAEAVEGMTVFIANFGRENYEWPECRRRGTIATMNEVDMQALWEKGDRTYVALSMARKTAAGIEPTKMVASRWFNLMTIVSESACDIWIHRAKDEGTLQGLRADYARYAMALLDGNDLSEWLDRPEWKSKTSTRLVRAGRSNDPIACRTAR